MERRWIRLRIRTMLALIAVSGVTMWGWRLKRLSDVYHQKVNYHIQEQQNHIKLVDYWEAQIQVAQHFIAEWEELRDSSRTEKDRSFNADMLERNRGYAADASRRLQTHRVKSAYQAALASKYRRAARYPFLFVTPDPPEPD